MVSLTVFNLIACTANQLCQPIYQSMEGDGAYNSAVVEVMAPLDCSSSHIKPALNSKGKDADSKGISETSLRRRAVCVSLNYQGIKETVIHLSNWNSWMAVQKDRVSYLIFPIGLPNTFSWKFGNEQAQNGLNDVSLKLWKPLFRFSFSLRFLHQTQRTWSGDWIHSLSGFHNPLIWKLT